MPLANFSSPGPVFASISIVQQATATSTSVDPDLVNCQVTLSSDSMTGQALVTHRNDNAFYSALGWEPGDILQVWVYKTGQSNRSYQIFQGPLQSIKYKKDVGGSHNKYMILRAADASAYLQNRMVNTAYQTFNVTSNPGYSVDYIVKDLVTNTANLMAVQYNISSASLGFSDSGVQPIPIYIQNIEFQQMSVFSALSQLAQYSGSTFFVQQFSGQGPILNFFQVGTVPSAVAITDPVITSFEMEDDGTNLQNVIYVDGGTQLSTDSQQAFTDFSQNPPKYAISTYNSAWTSGSQPIFAQQFTAGNLNLTELGMIIAKVQSNNLVPVNDLTGVIVYDVNDSPGMEGGVPDAVPGGNFTFTSDQVYTVNNLNTIANAGLNPFVYTNINATLIPGQKYWVILNAAYNDSSNFYYWYYTPTPLAAGPWASSTNGTTWTIQQSPGGPLCYQIQTSNGVLIGTYDPFSISTYGGLLYENSISSLGQTTGTNAAYVAFQYGQQILGTAYTNYGLAKKKRFLRLKTVVPDVPIYPGQSMNVTCSDIGLSAVPFNVVQVQYTMQDVSGFELALQLQRFCYTS